MTRVRVVVTVEVEDEDGGAVLPSVAGPEAVRAVQEAVDFTYHERGFSTFNPVLLRIVDVSEAEPEED
jgi:hypothetical protein